MSGSATVTPGKQFGAQEIWTPAKLNQAAAPSVQVDADAITAREMNAAAVSSKNFSGKTIVVDKTNTTPFILQSSDFVQGYFTDGVLIAGSPTFTSATANFTIADIGRGVSGPGIPIGATIATVVDVHTVTLSAPAVLNFTDGVISGGTNLASATAAFTVADNGRAVVSTTIPGGATLTDVDATNATLSVSIADASGVTFQINGRTVSNVAFQLIGRGKGWRFLVDGTGTGIVELYTGSLAGSIAAGSVAGSGSGLTIGSLVIDALGNATWGGALGVTADGKLFVGAATYAAGVVKIAQNGDVTIMDTNTSNHQIDTGAVNPAVSAVTSAPSGGAITNPTNVTLDCPTQYRRIYYRANAADGVTNTDTSFVSATAAFTILDVGKVIVAAGVTAGTYIKSVTNATTVVLSAATTATATAVDFQITPNQTDTLYVDGTPIVLTATTRIAARAYKNGEYSALGTWLYTASGGGGGGSTVANPTISPAPGTYGGGTLTVTLSCITSGSSIFYTTDGTSPTHDGSGNPTGTSVKVSSGATFAITTGTKTVKALGYKSTLTDSSITSATYTVTSSGGTKCATPAMSPAGFTAPGRSTDVITISTATAGAQIRYTKDGSTPTSSHGTLIAGTSGTATVAGNTNTQLQAIAFKSGLVNSDVGSEFYEFSSI